MVQIMISPSKEMAENPPISKRRPALLDLAKSYSSNEILTDDTGLYRAIHLYNGLQFRYLRNGLSEEDLVFLDSRLRILSAAYGVVKPFDGIRHYRQDFKTKGLYGAWSDKIYQMLAAEGQPILNLASDEFSKTVTRYATKQDTLVNVAFYEEDEKGTRKKHSTISKKGRGQMVNYIARHRIKEIQLVQEFDDMGYRFCAEESTTFNWVFIRLTTP